MLVTYSVPLERFDRLFNSYPTDVYKFICWTRCKTSIVLPVDIQRGSCNKRQQKYCTEMPLTQWKDIQSVPRFLHCRGLRAWDTGVNFSPAFHLPTRWCSVGVRCVCFPRGKKKKCVEKKIFLHKRDVFTEWPGLSLSFELSLALTFTPVTSLLLQGWIIVTNGKFTHDNLNLFWADTRY